MILVIIVFFSSLIFVKSRWYHTAVIIAFIAFLHVPGFIQKFGDHTSMIMHQSHKSLAAGTTYLSVYSQIYCKYQTCDMISTLGQQGLLFITQRKEVVTI